MRNLLIVIFTLLSTICSAQKFYGIDISNVNGSNDKWNWDPIMGTYAIKFDDNPFDLVYKFPGKNFIYTTTTGYYENMPTRYLQALNKLKDAFGKPLTGYTNVYGYNKDSINWADQIIINGGIIEHYWYINNNQTIRLVLRWDEKALTLITKHFPLLSQREFETDALKLRSEVAFAYPKIKKEDKERENKLLEYEKKQEAEKIKNENIIDKSIIEDQNRKSFYKELGKLKRSISANVIDYGTYKFNDQKKFGLIVELSNKSDKTIKEIDLILKISLPTSDTIIVQKKNLFFEANSSIQISLPKESLKEGYKNKGYSKEDNLKITRVEVIDPIILFFDDERVSEKILSEKYLKR